MDSAARRDAGGVSEGEGAVALRLALTVERGRVVRLAVVPRVQPALERVLVGGSPEDVRQRVPMLYAVCRESQRLAAALALEAAAGEAGQTREAARTAVRLECLREHLWRLAVRLPGLLGRESAEARPAMAALMALSRAPVAGRRALAREFHRQLVALLGTAELATVAQASAWLAASPASVPSALRTVRESLRDAGPARPDGVAALSAEEALAVAERLEARPALACRPVAMDARPRGTGPRARLHDHPVVAWLAARGERGLAHLMAAVLELLACAAFLAGRGDRPPKVGAGFAQQEAEGIGLGLVESPRGLLVHRVRQEAGRIVDYRLLAPTEWNFHPRGAIAELLLGQGEAPGLTWQQRSERFALALDPCVEVAIEVT